MTPAMTIRIEVAGYLHSDLVEWLDPLVAELLPSGNTLLSGVVPDQAAVHSLCNRVRDLGIGLASLTVTHTTEQKDPA